MILATDLNWIGKIVYNGLYKWVNGWGEFGIIGAFGVTVVLFTLFLKILTLPLDYWQKTMGRKNALKMEEMKPELDKINKQCGDNRELLMQKQRALYKQHRYSMFSACLPTILTLVIFIVVISGFNSAVRHHNSVIFEEISAAYDAAYAATIEEMSEETDDSVKAAAAIRAAEEKVLEMYKPERFLLTQNIFMPDSWKTPIPTVSDYSGSGMGKLNIKDVNKVKYEQVMRPIIQKYNKTEKGKNRWNGYMLLPLFAFALSILSAKLVKPPEQPAVIGQTAEQAKAQKSQAKIMQYMMPLIFGVFSLFYSTAFALYMVISNVFSTAFNLIYNTVFKKKDDAAREERLKTTLKK
jgi:YidC/Oxa1 family membrane protein insertase